MQKDLECTKKIITDSKLMAKLSQTLDDKETFAKLLKIHGIKISEKDYDVIRGMYTKTLRCSEEELEKIAGGLNLETNFKYSLGVDISDPEQGLVAGSVVAILGVALATYSVGKLRTPK